MLILELTVKHVPKIMNRCALRNSQIVFSPRRGFIFQGFQHLQKKQKMLQNGGWTEPKIKKMWSKDLRKTHLKNTFKKHMNNVSKTPSKIRSMFFPWRFFEVWSQRYSQGGPKGSPNHLPGSSLREKMPKWKSTVMTKLCFSRFNWRPIVIGCFCWGWQG